VKVEGRIAAVAIGLSLGMATACAAIVGVSDVPVPNGGNADGANEGDVVGDDLGDVTTGEDDGVPSESDEARSPGAESLVEAGPDAGEMSDAMQASDRGPCGYAAPLPRPTVDDGTQDLVLQLALRSVDLGIRLNPDSGDPPPRAGFNLDGLQTCPDQPCSMRSGRVPFCEAGCGVDNAGTPLFQTFAQLTNGRFNQDAFNTELTAGTWGLVFRIRHYNGGANDSQVEVSIFDSNGTMGGVPPRWDGTDVWTLDSSEVLAQSGVDASPAYIQLDAYVADHVLVAQIDRPLRLYGGSALGTLIFQSSGTYIVGTLTPDRPGTFRIDDGMFAGRWPTKYIAAGLEAVPDPVVDGGYLCPSSGSYPTIARVICSGADITAEVRTQNAATICDAVSFADGFTASPALMGPVTTRPAPPTSCPNAGLENCEY
jgi:hypothetical protein